MPQRLRARAARVDHRRRRNGLLPHQIEGLEDRKLLATVPAGFTDAHVAGGLSSPTAMAVAPDGRIFVAQDLSRAIAVFAPDGTAITRITDGPAAMSFQLAASAHDLVAEASDGVVRLAI